MARVELTTIAVEGLNALVRSHSLPHDTRARLRRCLAQLQYFPRLGPELAGRWSDLRFILGPWRWMLVVYRHDEAAELCVVVTIQDARTSRAVTTVT